jgi:cofilin
LLDFFSQEYKYIIFALTKDVKEIIVEKTSQSSDYSDFIADLPENEPRYAVYDFEFEKEGEGKRSKIVFLAWYVICDEKINRMSRVERTSL